MKTPLLILGGLALAGAGLLALRGAAPPPPPAAAGAAAAVASGEMVAVRLPALDGAALRGQRAFAASCAGCHGPNAGGVEGSGPPLVHRIYEPAHHADMAFLLAAERGVPAHHWRFGDMPAQPGVTRAEVADIVAFVRQLQRANGIE